MSEPINPTDAPIEAPTNPETQSPEPVDAPKAAEPEFKIPEGWKTKFKANGEEIEADLETLKKYASKAKGAEKAMEERALLKKRLEQIEESLKDPRKIPKVLRELGIDPREVYQTWNEDVTQWQQLTPEQQQQYLLQEQLKAKEAELQEIKSREAAERETQETQREIQRLQTEFDAAIAEFSLPNKPKTVAMMANYMKMAYEKGIEDFSVKEAAEMVKEELEDLRKATLESLTPEQAEELFGKEWLDKLRKHDLQKLKAQKVLQPKDGPASSQKSDNSKKKIVIRNIQDYRRALGRE